MTLAWHSRIYGAFHIERVKSIWGEKKRENHKENWANKFWLSVEIRNHNNSSIFTLIIIKVHDIFMELSIKLILLYWEIFHLTILTVSLKNNVLMEKQQFFSLLMPHTTRFSIYSSISQHLANSSLENCRCRCSWHWKSSWNESLIKAPLHFPRAALEIF